MAAPTVAGVSATGNSTTSGTLTADFPAAGQTVGRWLGAITFVRSAPADVNLPSASPGAWTLLTGDDDTHTNVTAEVAHKVSAGGSETAPTLSSNIVASLGTMGIVVAVDDWSGTLGDVLVSPANVGTNVNLIAPAVAAAPDESLVLRVYLNADNNAIGTPPAGLTQVFSQLVATQGRLAMHVFSGTQSGTGTTGTATLVAGGSDPWLCWTIVIPPAAGGSGATPTPAAIATTTTLPAATPTAGSTPPPGALATTTAFPAVAVSAGARVFAGPIATATTFPAATASGASTVTATPAPIATLTTFPAGSRSAGATVAPGAISSSTAFPPGTRSAGARVLASVIGTAYALPLAAALALGATVKALASSLVTGRRTSVSAVTTDRIAQSEVS